MKQFRQKVFKRENVFVILLLVASVLGLAGIPQQMGFTSDQIIMGLLAVLAVDTLVERAGYLDRIESQLKRIRTSNNVDNVIDVRSNLPVFTDLIEKHQEFWVGGKGLTFLLMQYGRHIEDAAKQGKRFRLLMLDPTHEWLMRALVLSSTRLGSVDEIRKLLNGKIEYCEKLLSRVPEGTVQVRLTDYLLPNAFSIVDVNRDGARATIEFYGYKISTNERIHIPLSYTREPQTYQYYQKQFERIWQDSRPLGAVDTSSDIRGTS